MKPTFPLIAILLLIMTASCTDNFQQEESLYAEEENEIIESTALLATDFEKQVLDAVNEYRSSLGLNTLVFTDNAYDEAESHTEYMISKGQLSHDNFRTRASRISQNTNASYVAENVAKNYNTAETVLNAWLNSNSHKNTIEGDFTHTTITVRKDANETLFYTQIFIKK